MSADRAPTATPVCDPVDAVRAVVISQVLFTTGHVLTTGGFLYYFANGLHPTAFLFSILLVTPEVWETCALLSRQVIARLGGRKRTWLRCFVLARAAALGIPLVAMVDLPERTAFWLLIAALGVSHALQSIAYTAYISWLSDLVPRECWGGFFGLRRMAQAAVLVLLPAVAALLRRDWSAWTSDAAVRAAYLTVFLTGNGLLCLTILPLLRLPDVPVAWTRASSTKLLREVAAVFQFRPLRGIVLCSLWLAAAQGLTQAVFFPYQVQVLRLPLEGYLALSSLMYLLQMPASVLGGWVSDRYGDRGPLVAGLLVVSCAMGFWLLARPGSAGWLIGAYALWGLFGVVNVCQRNLLLRTAPASDNAVPIAILEHLAGLAAGLAGLLGGYLLGWMQSLPQATGALWPYWALFIASWLGRATAPLWLLRRT